MRTISRFGIATVMACSATVAHAKDYGFEISSVSTPTFRARSYADDQQAGFTAATRIILDFIRYSNAIALAMGNLNDYVYIIYADGLIGKFKVCTGCSSQMIPQGIVSVVPPGATKRSATSNLSEIIYRTDYMLSQQEGVIQQRVRNGTVEILCEHCTLNEFY